MFEIVPTKVEIINVKVINGRKGDFIRAFVKTLERNGATYIPMVVFDEDLVTRLEGRLGEKDICEVVGDIESRGYRVDGDPRWRTAYELLASDLRICRSTKRR